MVTVADEASDLRAVENIVRKFDAFEFVQDTILPWKNLAAGQHSVQSFLNAREGRKPDSGTAIHRDQRARSNNGGEYMSTASAAWFPSRGIVHKLTTRHTPEQYPISERSNRTHIELSQPLQFSANMPNSHSRVLRVCLSNFITGQSNNKRNPHRTSDSMALCHR